MHRNSLLQQLAAHRPVNEREARVLAEVVAFVREQPHCFERTLTAGHITGSAWLLNSPGDRVLLTHHRKLDRWLQLGGHADGNPDVLAVALREAQEESGIAGIAPIHTSIFDVDVHVIPARAGEPQHKHYDIRYLMRTLNDDKFQVSQESHELAWVSVEELPRLHTDESVLRMHRKWGDLIHQTPSSKT